VHAMHARPPSAARAHAHACRQLATSHPSHSTAAHATPPQTTSHTNQAGRRAAREADQQPGCAAAHAAHDGDAHSTHARAHAVR
jgi:hypothetical protein